MIKRTTKGRPCDDSTPGIWAYETSHGRWQMARHLMVLDKALTKLAYTPNSRLIVEMPVRHGKSMLGSVYFPAWYRRKFPRRNFMLWSATSRLAQRFSTHVRELCAMPIDEKTHSWEHWKLAGSAPNEGEFYAGGIGSGATMGAGFHCALIDDYHRNVEDALSEQIRKKQQEWFLSSAMTRAEPGASFAVFCTRWHRDDLIGFIERNAEETGEVWEHIRLKAIDEEGKALWPERWPIEALERVRKRYAVSGYPWMWEALYQQEPPETIDSEWDPAYFGPHIFFDRWPAMDKTRLRIMALDPSVGQASKSDYSAIVLLGVGVDDLVYLEADLQRRDGEKQVRDVLTLAQAFCPLSIGVEINGFQGVLEGMFNRRCQEMAYWPYIHGVRAQTEKRMRIRAAITPLLARGVLRFKRHSPGTSLLLEQLRGFPSHKYDDGPDALAMGLECAAHVAQYGLIETGRDPLVITA